ncbi:hypothetical protein [Methylosinus sp. Sm6]|uniref:hypothetical protein n=1 Tax=Methylosinus sp. Sm6 TaxID=2866948 RepID=UPI001C99B133|nr:hypothetical protein [Methylosinus sp. Sm6]MBY6243944.1 hypothetical protein [Methylosinus sp. Sm6]
MMVEEEIGRLNDGKTRDQAPPESVILELIVETDGDAKNVLSKVKNTLICVLENIHIRSNIELWSNKLPDWLIDAFSPEMSEAEAFSPEMSEAEALEWLDMWRKLPNEEKKIAELKKGWSFNNWINWFYPEHRSWYWWGAHIKDRNNIGVFILLKDDSGVAYGALEWLFVKAGAISVEAK